MQKFFPIAGQCVSVSFTIILRSVVLGCPSVSKTLYLEYAEDTQV